MFRRFVLAAIGLAIFATAPAAAHTDLVKSAPKDNQTLSAPPEEVALTFGEDLLTGGARLVAKDEAGVAVDLGPAQVKGAVLSAAWPSAAAAGTYTVSYRAVASDGHPLEGRITFSVESPQSPASPSPAAAPAAVDPAPTPTPQASNPWMIAAPLLLVAALAVGGFIVWRSRD